MSQNIQINHTDDPQSYSQFFPQLNKKMELKKY